MKPKVLLTKSLPDPVLEYLADQLSYEIMDPNLSITELPEGQLQSYEAIICDPHDEFNMSVLMSLKKLRIIVILGESSPFIDKDKATSLNIALCHTPDIMAESEADFTWAMMLTLARHLQLTNPSSDRMVAAVDMLRGIEMWGSILAIIGMSAVGKAVARRAMTFGMKIFYWDFERLPEEDEKARGLTYLSLEKLLSIADFITVHLESAAHTPPIIDIQAVEWTRDNVYYIQTSTLAAIDMDALFHALERGNIKGAALDIAPRDAAMLKEQSKRNKQVEQRLLVTPSIATATTNAQTRSGIMATNNILAYLQGMKPPNLMNSEVWKPKY